LVYWRIIRLEVCVFDLVQSIIGLEEGRYGFAEYQWAGGLVLWISIVLEVDKLVGGFGLVELISLWRWVGLFCRYCVLSLSAGIVLSQWRVGLNRRSRSA
jgi:hypothetical protein